MGHCQQGRVCDPEVEDFICTCFILVAASLVRHPPSQVTQELTTGGSLRHSFHSSGGPNFNSLRVERGCTLIFTFILGGGVHRQRRIKDSKPSVPLRESAEVNLH